MKCRDQKTRIGVYGIALRDRHLLLTMKTAGAYEGLLDLPGGGIEFGENHEMALRREFQEEVGMAFTTCRLVDNCSHCQEVVLPPDWFQFHHLGSLYMVDDPQELPTPGQDPFGWYHIDELTSEQLTPFAKVALGLVLS